MSAYVDQDQVVKFYFGNAMKDLEAFLPPDDHAQRPQPIGAPQNDMPATIEHSLSSLENTLAELKSAHRELSYLVGDLGRMIKKV
jgi:hypothetical protein